MGYTPLVPKANSRSQISLTSGEVFLGVKESQELQEYMYPVMKANPRFQILVMFHPPDGDVFLDGKVFQGLPKSAPSLLDLHVPLEPHPCN